MSSIGRVSVSSARNSKRPNETNIRVDKNVSSGDQHNEAPAPFQGMSRIPCGWSLPLSSAIHLLAWPSRRPALGVTRRPSDRPLLITIVRRTDGEGANRAAAAAINRRPDKVLIVVRCPLSEGGRRGPSPPSPASASAIASPVRWPRGGRHVLQISRVRRNKAAAGEAARRRMGNGRRRNDGREMACCQPRGGGRPGRCANCQRKHTDKQNNTSIPCGLQTRRSSEIDAYSIFG